jgi:hypothetical protein
MLPREDIRDIGVDARAETDATEAMVIWTSSWTSGLEKRGSPPISTW